MDEHYLQCHVMLGLEPSYTSVDRGYRPIGRLVRCNPANTISIIGCEHAENSGWDQRTRTVRREMSGDVSEDTPESVDTLIRQRV